MVNMQHTSPNTLNSIVNKSFVQKANSDPDSAKTYHFGNTALNQNQLNDYASTQQKMNDLNKQTYDLMLAEIKKGQGITQDFTQSTLAPIQKDFYALENQRNSQYGNMGGLGGESNFYGYGIDRDSLGMNTVDANGFRKHDTNQEYEAQQNLIQQGVSAQGAYQTVRGINPNVAYSPTNQFNNNNSMFNYSPQNQSKNGGSESMVKASSNNVSFPTNSKSGIPDYQMSEIIRKAQAGIQLDKPTPEKMAVYEQYAKPKFDQDSYTNRMQSQVNSIFDQQRNAQIAQFNAERDRSLGLINQQKAEVAPQYASARNQTDVVNAQNVAKLRELMAANGISASGENVTANIALGSARQGALSQLNLQEQQTNNDFNRQIADINNPDRINALIAQLEAQRSEALYNAYNRADDVGYSRGRDDIMDSRYAEETQYNQRRDAVGDQRYDQQFNYQQQRDQVGDQRYDQQFNYQQQRDQVGDQRYDQQFNYQQQRDQVGDNQWQQQFNQSIQQHAQEMAWRRYSYNNMSASEKARMDQAASQFGEEMAWRMYSLEYQGELDKAMYSAQLGIYGNGNINAKGGHGGGGQDTLRMIN